MRILFLITQDLNSPAGGSRYFPLAKALASLGHQTRIVGLSSDFEHLLNRHFIKDGVIVDFPAPMHLLKQGDLKIYYPSSKLLLLTARATWSLTRIALSSPTDIIHIGKPHPMNSPGGLLGRYLRGRKVFLDCDDYEAATGRFRRRWQKWVVSLFEDHVPLHVNGVTTHTTFMQQRLIDLGVPREKIHYLPNGIDIDRFNPPDLLKVQQIQNELGIQGRKVVAFIGSLSSPSHPIELLLQAFVFVHTHLPDTILLIVGGGEDINQLKEKCQILGINESVEFTGRVPGEIIALYYRIADAIVDPVEDNLAAISRLPLKLFESWACGVPFITADVGDRRLILGSPAAGVLVRPGDPLSLAQGIIRVLENPDYANQLRHLGQILVQQYTWDHLAQNMEVIYKQVLEV